MIYIEKFKLSSSRLTMYIILFNTNYALKRNLIEYYYFLYPPKETLETFSLH